MIAPESLAGVHVFFPDPWHKKRHHKRRLIQPPFVRLLASRLAPGGDLHCATDWQPYAEQMLAVLSAEPALVNTAGEGYAPRPDSRPLTKFEQPRPQARPRRVGPRLREAPELGEPARQRAQPARRRARSTPSRARRCRTRCGTRRTARSVRRDVAQQPAHADPRGEEARRRSRPRTAAGRPPTAARAPSTGCTPPAPISVGIARKKLNSVAALRDRPSSMPPMIVAPERLVPGIMPRHWHEADLQRVDRRHLVDVVDAHGAVARAARPTG